MTFTSPAGTLAFRQDDDGTVHFAEEPPARTLIDVHGISFPGNWIKIDNGRGTVTITLDGHTVVYRRVAKDIHGKWICERE